MAAVRTYDEENKYLEKINGCSYRIKKGFVPGMNVRTGGSGITWSVIRLRVCFM
jgi:hypothetical protein